MNEEIRSAAGGTGDMPLRPAGDELCREDERMDDLERSGCRILQKKKGFCFGMDAVLLSGFAQVREGEKVIDLGTGTGILPILLEAKTPGSHFTGLEIQADMADMASRSVRLNRQEAKVSIVNGDIREASRLFGKASFDVAVSNPPYMNDSHGLKNPDLPKAVARHEVLCTLEDVVREAALLVKPGGRFYMVHRPRRLAEIMVTLKGHGLEPKRIRFVHPYREREANMVLLESVRGGKPMLKVEPPLIVHKPSGEYMEEIRTVYGY